jgi:uncharacterized protein
MSPTTWMLIFGVSFFFVHLAVHTYLWRRLITDTGLQGRRRLGAMIALGAVFALLPASLVVARTTPPGSTGWLTLPAFLWMGSLFYLVTILGLVDLARIPAGLIAWVRRRKERAAGSEPDAPADPERRLFLARAAAVSAVGCSGVLMISGMRSALGDLERPEVPVRLERLPPALDGFRIVHLTDLHVGPTLGEGFARSVVEQTNALRPDLVVLTGDLVDGSVAVLGNAMAPLADLRARYGVAMVTGNHEYYSGAEQWIQWLRRAGVTVLKNQRISIGDKGPGGASFDLAGVCDRWAARHLPSHAADVAGAVAGRDEDRELVLLAHQPAQVRQARGHGVGLQVSGHTHGGQLWPAGFLAMLAQPYLTGLHSDEGGSQVFVSRGAGFWGPPMRVGAPPEIPTLVLTS